MARHGNRSRSAPRKKGSQAVPHTLDQFSLNDLRHWNRANRDIEEYQLRVYHELEAQRQLNKKEIFGALKDAKHSKPLQLDRWSRMLDFHIPTSCLLSAAFAVSVVDSISARTSESPHLSRTIIAEDADTAFREYYGMERSEQRNDLTPLDLALTPKRSFACVNVSGTATNVLDITDASRLKALAAIFATFRIDPRLKKLLRRTSLKPMEIVRDPKTLLRSIQIQRWRELGMQLGIRQTRKSSGGLRSKPDMTGYCTHPFGAKAVVFAYLWRTLLTARRSSSSPIRRQEATR